MILDSKDKFRNILYDVTTFKIDEKTIDCMSLEKNVTFTWNTKILKLCLKNTLPLIHIKKKVKSMMMPWGPSASTGLSCKDIPLRTTQSNLLLSNENIKLKIRAKIP